MFNNNLALDDVQQYLRRDCVEITGIPVPILDNPKLLVVQVDKMIGLELNEAHISTAHRFHPQKR